MSVTREDLLEAKRQVPALRVAAAPRGRCAPFKVLVVEDDPPRLGS